MNDPGENWSYAKLSERLGEHGGVVGLVDDPVAPLVLFQERRGEVVVAEAAAPLPTHALRDAAGVLAVDHLLQTRDDVGVAVLAQLYHDPAPPHLVGNGTSGSGPGEGVEDEVAKVC